MNERIIDLANEANEAVGFEFELTEARKLHELMEKFAELIIQECVGVELYWLSEQNREAVAEKIKQHFGIEE
jgi:hypothetical protein